VPIVIHRLVILPSEGVCDNYRNTRPHSYPFDAYGAHPEPLQQPVTLATVRGEPRVSNEVMAFHKCTYGISKCTHYCLLCVQFFSLRHWIRQL